MPRRVTNRELLDDFLEAGNLLCKFGQQLKDWERRWPEKETYASVYRAKAAGVSVDAIHDVLVSRGYEDVSTVKTMREHFAGSCRCPRRR